MSTVPALDNFRTNVRTTIERAEISQRDLAEKAGLSFVYVNRILMAKAEPSLPVCEDIATKGLGAKLAAFLVDPKNFRIPRHLLLQAVKR